MEAVQEEIPDLPAIPINVRNGGGSIIEKEDNASTSVQSLPTSPSKIMKVASFTRK